MHLDNNLDPSRDRLQFLIKRARTHLLRSLRGHRQALHSLIFLQADLLIRDRLVLPFILLVDRAVLLRDC